MRVVPLSKYNGMPCSYVGVGSAYEDIYNKEFNAKLPDGLKNGYLSLNSADKFIREHLPVKKKEYFKKGERPILQDFLFDNEKHCCICVYGHFIYVNGQNYWSFFNNCEDEIVCIWYLKEEEISNAN